MCTFRDDGERVEIIDQRKVALISQLHVPELRPFEGEYPVRPGEGPKLVMQLGTLIVVFHAHIAEVDNGTIQYRIALAQPDAELPLLDSRSVGQNVDKFGTHASRAPTLPESQCPACVPPVCLFR